jgi:hypothetical protein
MNGGGADRVRTALAICFIAASAIAFFVIATRHLNAPGLYYDEALFYPPAAKLYIDCGIIAGVKYKIGCVPIVLQPPYLGALKAWLYAVLFLVVTPSPLTLRLPMVLLQFASIILLLIAWAPRMGRSYAILLFVILCTDTIAIFHARIDWGPYVIANFFKVAALCAAIMWVETKRPCMLTLAGLSMVLGVYDKLNFIWVVGALTAALLFIYGREVFAALKSSRASRLILIVSAVAAMDVVLLLGSATWGVRLASPEFDLASQIARVWHLIALTLDEGPFELVFGTPWPGLRLASRIFSWGLAVGWLLVLMLPVLRMQLGREDRVAVKVAYAAFLTLILSFLCAAMVLTKETSGPHHAIVVSLLWPLQVVLCGVALVSLAGSFAPSLRTLAYLPVATAAAAIIVHNLSAAAAFHRALDRGIYGNANFSPAIYKLARFVDAHPGVTVVSVDWGIHNGLMALAEPGTQRRFRDLWPTFTEIGKGSASPLVPAIILGEQGRSMFVMHPEAISTFKESFVGFEASVKSDCERSRSIIRDEHGGAIFIAMILPNGCLRHE